MVTTELTAETKKLYNTGKIHRRKSSWHQCEVIAGPEHKRIFDMTGSLLLKISIILYYFIMLFMYNCIRWEKFLKIRKLKKTNFRKKTYRLRCPNSVIDN